MKRLKKRLRKPKFRYPFERHALFRCPGPLVLARLLQCNLKHLESLANNSSDQYNVWDDFNADGKARRIEAPKDQLRDIHLRIAELLLKLQTPEFLHSGLPKRSIVSNANAHLSYAETIKLDIKKFYPSTLRAHVFEFFHLDLEMKRDCAALLAKLCTYEGHIPTGSVLSQILAFWSHRRLFDQIACLAKRKNGVFTLYVDDLTLSFLSATRNDLRSIDRLIRKRGLIAHKARHYKDGCTRVITGVALKNGKLRVTNSLHQRIAQARAELRSSKNGPDQLKKAQRLAGRINAAAFIEPALSGKAKAVQSLVRRLR